jgi:glyoxylase I family protein
MTTPFGIGAIDHVVLRVRDMDRMIAFYRDVLGCPIEKRQDEIGLIQLRAGTALVDLVDVNGRLGREGGAPPGSEARNVDHIAFRIAPFNAARIRAHLTKHGIEAGDVAERYGAEGSGPSIYLKDPEGNGIELKGPVQK